jgi:uncharacterized protein (DUF58 family)
VNHAHALPWWAWRARARRRLAHWWQQRLPATDTLTLTQHNVYILPTRAGWMLAATLVILLVTSINYQLNLGYLLTFLLAGCVAAGMVVGHSTLRGLTLSVAPPQPVFAGTPASLEVRLANRRRQPRLAIGVALRASRQWAWADVPAGGESELQIRFLPPGRGLHAIPVLVAETRFPLGSFRVWALWRPAARVLVYPTPETPAPPLPAGQPSAGSGAASESRALDEFDGVRGYQPGDSMRRIVWKKYARSGELVTRDTQLMQRQALWLDFARAGALDPEARLARLAAWVLAADRQGLDYGLRLPGLEIAPDTGAAQRLRCLEALALC